MSRKSRCIGCGVKTHSAKEDGVCPKCRTGKQDERYRQEVKENEEMRWRKGKPKLALRIRFDTFQIAQPEDTTDDE